jgi:hypothetical protein
MVRSAINAFDPVGIPLFNRVRSIDLKWPLVDAPSFLLQRINLSRILWQQVGVRRHC